VGQEFTIIFRQTAASFRDKKLWMLKNLILILIFLMKGFQLKFSILNENFPTKNFFHNFSSVHNLKLHPSTTPLSLNPYFTVTRYIVAFQ